MLRNKEPSRLVLAIRRGLALAALLFIPLAVWAQTPAAILEYADNEDLVQIVDADGFGRPAVIGEEVVGGETVKTGNSAVELKLVPNGTIVKISRNTTFKVEGLAGTAGRTANEFALLAGKIRTVAAKTAAGEQYRIRTQSAVCGVRGTDFNMTVVEGKQDAVFVKRGLVEFARNVGGVTESVMVGAGQFADALGATFAAAAFSADQFAAEFADMEFTALDPAGVTQADAPAEPPAETPAEPVNAGDATAAAEGETVTEEVEAPIAPDVSDAESKVMAWLREVLGFEIGSVIIEGKTYSKAIIQPTFNFGKGRIGLYLPVIYTSDLFDPSTWYRPSGNDEWSFGTDYFSKQDYVAGAFDALTDFALKFRFVEIGDRYVDPFYFNIGNLSSMTIGHGVIMRNFANDSDFPSVRRVGLNTGFDAGFWGVEAVVNDLAAPEIFGGRLKLFNVLGFSAIADISPAKNLDTAGKTASGDPLLIGAGIDFDLPILKLPFLNIRLFADAAAVMPWTRTDIVPTVGDTIKAGPQISTIYDPDNGSGIDALRNYGLVAGLLGRLLIVDYRIEYRNYRGAFRPTFFDASYERNRGTYALDFADMLTATTADDSVKVNGIYGEAGFTILKDKLTFNAGYMAPWSLDDQISDWDTWVDQVARNDYLLAKLVVRKGLIPIVDIAGEVSYERTGFLYALFTDTANVGLFDANTVFKGELVYPIAQGVDFATVLSTATSGYENGRPVIEPTMTFETRIHF